MLIALIIRLETASQNSLKINKMHPLLNHRKPCAQRSKHYAQLGWIALAIALLSSVAGCASGPSNVAVESRDVILKDRTIKDRSAADEDEYVATPLADRDYQLQQAERYAELAENTDSDNAIDAALSAAEFYIQGDDPQRAAQTIAEIETYQLSTEQSYRYEIIKAYTEYSRNEYRVALARMQRLLSEPESQTENTRQQRVDALLLSSFCYQQLGQMGESISMLIERESLLYGAARAETSRYIWQVIEQMSSDQRQQVMARTLDVNVRNRLEQSMQGQVGNYAAQPEQFDVWRSENSSDLRAAAPGNWSATSPRSIAILLPQSSRYDKAAQAVLDGINYQHSVNQSPYRPQLFVYDIGNNPYQVRQYYTAAQQRGADLIIGPLGKDYADALVQASNDLGAGNYSGANLVATLLLGGETPLPAQMSRLSLSPERESKQIVERALARGFVNAAVLAPLNERGARSANAFTSQWLSAGGKISKVINYSTEQFDHSTELRQLFNLGESEARYRAISEVLGYKPKFSAYRRGDIDFILMIADNKTGRIVRPQINYFSGNQVPVMATAEIYNGKQAIGENMDLNGTSFPVMPWVLASREVAIYAGQLNELFALGSDAYQLAAELSTLRSDPNKVLQGNTGQLHMGDSGEIIIRPMWAVFNEGRAESDQEIAEIENPLLLDNQRARERLGLDPRNDVKRYDDTNWDPRQSRRKSGS